jgi:hypothetical protein
MLSIFARTFMIATLNDTPEVAREPVRHRGIGGGLVRRWRWAGRRTYA